METHSLKGRSVSVGRAVIQFNAMQRTDRTNSESTLRY